MREKSEGGGSKGERVREVGREREKIYKGRDYIT